MATKTLAVKYRPRAFKDIVEQNNIKIILQQQLESGEVKNAYLFCGPAGDGKTTTARIFANEINKGQGNPIEMDAASNSGVDDVRNIIQQAQGKSLDSEYKVFIIDECHSISNTGWQAFLKLIEEPPAKSIFIFCTTDPQKIPKTILSRVQRYDFHRISQQGIIYRLNVICANENVKADDDAIEYIAKMADGGMRDAISLMEKCLAFSSELTLQNVVDILGTVDYKIMFQLTDDVIDGKFKEVVGQVDGMYSSGKDMKQFVKQYVQFLLDAEKFGFGCDWEFLNIPRLPEYEEWLLHNNNTAEVEQLLRIFIGLNAEIKFSSTPRQDIEVALFLYIEGDKNDRSGKIMGTN